MKKCGLFVGLFLMTFVCWAQQGVTYEELVVKAPTYGGEVEIILKGNELASPIGKYLNYKLTRQAEFLNEPYNEGTVIVDFTVYPDGTIDHFIVQNSVSGYNDKAVLYALKSTSGDWIAGEKDGTPIEMQKRIVISFSNDQNTSLEEQAILQYQIGLKRFFDANNLSNDFFLTKEQIFRKKERKLYAAIYRFENATRLVPNQPSVIYWEMRAYSELGNVEMQKKLNTKLQDFVQLFTDPNTEFVAILF